MDMGNGKIVRSERVYVMCVCATLGVHLNNKILLQSNYLMIYRIARVEIKEVGIFGVWCMVCERFLIY